MEISELAAESWFWPAVTALVTLAALVGSGFSWAVATYFRWRTRPEPDWMFNLHGQAFDGNDRSGETAGYAIRGTVTNVGDGTAYSVKMLEVKACSAGISSRPKTPGVVPVMDKGDTESVSIRIPFGSWESAEVTLEWIAPPTRLKKRKELQVDFRSMMDAPGVQYTDEDGVVAYRSLG